MAKPTPRSKARPTSRPRKLRSPAKRLTAEEKAFLDTLAANKQVQTGRGKLRAGVTHTVEKPPKARRAT